MQWLVENVRNVGAAAFERKPVARAVQEGDAAAACPRAARIAAGSTAQQTLKKVVGEYS